MGGVNVPIHKQLASYGTDLRPSNKSFKQNQVVKDVSVSVNAGEIVGLLGPNGAGKTTSFYMIVGLIKPNEGQIFSYAEKAAVIFSREPCIKNNL